MVTESWDLIEAWLHERAPHLAERLPAGATDAAIDAAARELGVTWPTDLREAWRRHDGSGGAGVLDGLELLSLDAIVEHWKGLTELERGGSFRGGTVEASRTVREVWWNESWIPITHDGCGNHACVDFDALTSEAMGQLLCSSTTMPRAASSPPRSARG